MPNMPSKLTEDQKRLAGEPKYVAIAWKLAKSYTKLRPHLRDEFDSAAMEGLCLAARMFDGDRECRNGPSDFGHYVTYRVRLALRDVVPSSRPRGFRGGKTGSRNAGSCNGGSCKTSPPRIRPASELADEGETPLDELTSGELPIGWEAEWQDTIEGLAKRLPRRHRRIFRSYYIQAATGTHEATARAVGLTKRRVMQVTASSIAMLRKVEWVEDLKFGAA